MQPRHFAVVLLFPPLALVLRLILGLPVQPPLRSIFPNRNLIRLLLLTMTLILLMALSPHKAKAATNCSSVTEIPAAECQALVALYNSTSGPNWVRQDNWLVTTTPCSWYGITCTSGTMPQHVDKIVLQNNELTGDIPPEIGNLSNLQVLLFSSNQLSSLPPEIGNLYSLQIV